MEIARTVSFKTSPTNISALLPSRIPELAIVLHLIRVAGRTGKAHVSIFHPRRLAHREADWQARRVFISSGHGQIAQVTPKEVFELATSTPNMEFIMGNHDYWFAFGIPHPRPAYMSEAELEHQQWNHAQIGEVNRNTVQKWKFVEEHQVAEAKKITFAHYGYDEKENWFKDFVKEPDQENMDHLFEGIDSDMIFYGHMHEPSDVTGNSRYVNLGSAGCHTKPEVRLGILEIEGNNLRLEKLAEPYDDDGLMEAFELRQVPAREFITKHFIVRN